MLRLTRDPSGVFGAVVALTARLQHGNCLAQLLLCGVLFESCDCTMSKEHEMGPLSHDLRNGKS